MDENEVIVTDELAQELMDDPHPLQAEEGWATLGRDDANAEPEEGTATDAGESLPEVEDELEAGAETANAEGDAEKDAEDDKAKAGEGSADADKEPEDAEQVDAKAEDGKDAGPGANAEKDFRVLRKSHEDLKSLREQIGDAEPILGETVNLAKAFISGNADAIAEAAMEVSKAGFTSLITGALENLAEEYVAQKYELSRADFDARLSAKAAPAKMSDTLKESLEYLEPEVREEIETAFKAFAQMEREQAHAKALMDKERETAKQAAERTINASFDADVDSILNGMLEKLDVTPQGADYKAQHAAINAIVDALHPDVREAYRKHFKTGEKAPKALTRAQLERATAQAVKTFFGERAATAKPAVAAPAKAASKSTDKPANNPPAVPQVRKPAPVKAKPKINTGRITPSLLAEIAAGVDTYFEAKA